MPYDVTFVLADKCHEVCCHPCLNNWNLMILSSYHSCPMYNFQNFRICTVLTTIIMIYYCWGRMPTTGARLEKKRITISRYLAENDIKLYWEKFKMNFGEDRVRVWNGLMAGLRKYHEILKGNSCIFWVSLYLVHFRSSYDLWRGAKTAKRKCWT